MTPVSRALGFANPGAMLAGLGGMGEGAADSGLRAAGALAGGAAAAGSTTMSAGGAAAAAGATGLSKWWPWLLGVVVVAFLWWLFAPKAPVPASTPSASTSVTQSAKSTGAMSPAFPAKIYFDTGSAAVNAEGSKTVTAIAEAIKRDSLKTSITGYTDKTGDAATNEALAKSRAVAVRDALTAAGVAESSIEMRPPLFVAVGGGTTDAEARRVEINRQ